MARELKLFISHSWDNYQHLKDLRRLLNDRGYFNVSFEEVPKHEPINSTRASYIKSKLSSKISNSNIVIGLAGMYASYSNWIGMGIR